MENFDWPGSIKDIVIKVDNIYIISFEVCAQTIPEEKMERTDATFGEVEGKLFIQYFQVKEGKAYLHEQNSQLLYF